MSLTRLQTDLQRTSLRLFEARRQLQLYRTKWADADRKYRLLAENVTDIIWILDLSTLKFTYISPSVMQQRGFTPEEAMQLDLAGTLSPRSLARITRLLKKEVHDKPSRCSRPPGARTVELQQSVKGGGYAWAEATVSVLRDKNGRPTALMGVTRDISERKRSEARIAESEKKYRNLFENGSDLLCVHDLDGYLLETNIPFKSLYGWSREDLEGQKISDLIPERYRDRFDTYLQRVLTAGSDSGYMTVVTKTGEKRVLEFRNKLMQDDTGAPMAVQGAARDVTDRVKAEKALKESEEKYREIVQHAPAGIYEFDLQTMKFTSVNDVMCEYSGYSEAEFLQLDPYDLLPEESRKTFKNLLQEVFAGRENPQPREYKIRTKNGREFWVLSNARFFYENGVPCRAMSVVHDLTDLRKAEAEKRELEIKLQNAQKLESLGTLAGGVAHDLNNILSGIVSYPELLLLDLEEGSRLRNPLLTIKKSGEKAAEIVQDLLTLARRGVATKKIVNLNDIVRDFFASPEFRKIGDDHANFDAEASLAEDLLNIAGSEVHLSKSLMNLVANGADAMPSGGKIIVSTANCYIDKAYHGYEDIPEGEYATLQIADSGIGMPKSNLGRIFEPFYTKKVMGRSGSGLGMSVVWGTLKDHDGYIDIITEEGLGTTFVLYFPINRMEKKIAGSVYIEDYLGQGESILVVDDSREQRELAERMMQRLGYRVETVASGEEAVTRVHEKTYDIVILDMIMPPGMNGLETYRQILEFAPLQRAVIASGYTETELVHQAQRLGAGSYIKKPYTLEKIGIAVRAELDRR